MSNPVPDDPHIPYRKNGNHTVTQQPHTRHHTKLKIMLASKNSGHEKDFNIEFAFHQQHHYHWNRKQTL